MATAVEEKTIEKGAEKVVDGLEDIAVAAPASINKGVLLVGGIIIGVSVGFLVAKKRLEAKYAEMAEEEIQAIRDLYFQKEKKAAGVRVDPKGGKETLQEVMAKAGYQPPTEQDQRYTDAEQQAIDEANEAAARAEEEAEDAIGTVIVTNTGPVTQNIFPAGALPEWDWDVEKTIREEGHNEVPYVLHRDEYIANESGWEQMVLTYFEGDDVLADNHDTPVDDQDAMVGLGNLAKFGHGSGDPNTVYVRNPELNIEIEIIHSDGKFSEQRRGIPVDPPRDETGKFAPRNQGSTDPRKRRTRGD